MINMPLLLDINRYKNKGKYKAASLYHFVFTCADCIMTY